MDVSNYYRDHILKSESHCKCPVHLDMHAVACNLQCDFVYLNALRLPLKNKTRRSYHDQPGAVRRLVACTMLTLGHLLQTASNCACYQRTAPVIVSRWLINFTVPSSFRCPAQCTIPTEPNGSCSSASTAYSVVAAFTRLPASSAKHLRCVAVGQSSPRAELRWHTPQPGRAQLH
jgi:hypothetical protein